MKKAILIFVICILAGTGMHAQDIDTLFLHPSQTRGKNFQCTTFTPVRETLYPLSLNLHNKRIGYRLIVTNDEIRIRD